MKQYFKLFPLLALSIVLILVVAACSNDSNKEKANSSNKKVTLDFLWFTDGIEGDVMKDIIKDYQASNENVEINLIEVAYEDFSTKLKTMIAGGKPPALARITDTGIFADRALDLSEYVGDVDEFTSQFLPSIKPYYIKDEKIIAAPMDVTANGLIYNKTLFDKAGVEVPETPEDIWTWDEFATAIQQVKEKGGAKYGLLVDFTPHRYSTMIYEYGGSIFNQDLSAPAINEKESVAALDKFVQLHQDEIIPESVWLGGENPNNLFRSGTAAAHLAGNWMLSNYQDIGDFEWGVTYLPKGENRSSVPGGKYIMAFENSGVEEEAAEFVKYLASQEVNAKFNQESLFLSARLDNNELDYEFGKEMFKVFSNELENTPEAAANDWGNQVVISKVTTDIRDAVVEAISGNVSAQESMDKVAEKLKEAIEDSK